MSQSIKELCKSVAEGVTTSNTAEGPFHSIPNCILHEGKLPRSRSAAITSSTRKIKRQATAELVESPRARHLKSIDNKFPQLQFPHLVANLSRRQASLLFQLRSGHVPLNKHLYRIGKAETPACPKRRFRSETVLHFLLMCPGFEAQRNVLTQKLGLRARSMTYLLSSPKAMEHLFRYTHSTKRIPHSSIDLQTQTQRAATPRQSNNARQTRLTAFWHNQAN